MIAREEWSAAWQDSGIPEYQGSQAKIDIAEWMSGKPHVAFDALAGIVNPISKWLAKRKFIEIGCGCGYGSAVIKRVAPDAKYYGLDFSEDMLAYARENWPGEYIHGDANRLVGVNCSFNMESFGCVCLAAVIQHVADWRHVIKQGFLLSSRYVILHRAQCTSHPTNEFENAAYGTSLPTRENNESELVQYCQTLGMKMKHVVRWGMTENGEQSNASFLFEKV